MATEHDFMATIKQKMTFKEVVKGSTIKGAMRKAGYSEETSKRTNKVTRTKGWEELLEKHIPDSLLAKRHRELLNKQEVIIIRDGKESHTELTEQPHTDVKAAIDMGYKLKGKYAAEKHEVQVFTLEELFKNAKSN